MRTVLAAIVATAALLVAANILLAEEGKSKPEASDPGTMFQQLDANKDGQLTSDEVPAEKKRIFERLLRIADKDHDGKLTAEEFAAGLKDDGHEHSGEPGAAQEEGRHGGAEQRFHRLDANGDGKITLDEVPEQRREMFARLIERGDKNGDKALSLEEFTDVVRQFGGGPGGEGRDGSPHGQHGQRMFRYLDKNGDGKVTLDEVPEGRREFFERLIERGDKNGDKALSQEEFTDVMSQFGGRSPGEFGRHGAGGEFGRLGGVPGIGLFRALDTDGDQKLSKAEIDAAPEVLRKLDRDGDGTVTPQEVLGDGPGRSQGHPEKSPGSDPDKDK